MSCCWERFESGRPSGRDRSRKQSSCRVKRSHRPSGGWSTVAVMPAFLCPLRRSRRLFLPAGSPRYRRLRRPRKRRRLRQHHVRPRLTPLHRHLPHRELQSRAIPSRLSSLTGEAQSSPPSVGRKPEQQRPPMIRQPQIGSIGRRGTWPGRSTGSCSPSTRRRRCPHRALPYSFDG
jgi:hypothetical protein